MSFGHLDMGRDRFPMAVEGSAAPIMFVHGVPGDWRTFAPHAAILADRYRCITFTQRWFGNAEWRDDGPAFGTETHAADLIAIAEGINIGRIALVAWSYGAHGALKAALDRPDLFSALLAYEPGFATYIDDPAQRAEWKEDADAAWGPVFAARGDEEAMLRAMWDASAGAGSFDALSPQEQADLREGAQVLPRLLDQTPPAELTCEMLGRLQIPVTVAWGKDTRPCYRISSEAAADCIGGDRFEIGGADHMWPVRNPEGFARMVDHWHGRLSEGGSLYKRFF